MSSRRAFLAATSASVASAAASPSAASAASGPFDFAAVDERLARPSRHKQVFAVARVADGTVVAMMKHSIDAYEITMGEGRGALHAAAVFYSRGVLLGLGDAMWRTYRLGEASLRRGDSIGTAQTRHNPFSQALAELQKRGATLLVCDNALVDWATYLVSVGGFAEKTPEDVHAEFRRNLLPGALLVPAGVAALNAAQEARFTYVQASL
jgi:intracellular sulfur oxidation DsrE/DsrF family protein